MAEAGLLPRAISVRLRAPSRERARPWCQCSTPSSYLVKWGFKSPRTHWGFDGRQRRSERRDEGGCMGPSHAARLAGSATIPSAPRFAIRARQCASFPRGTRRGAVVFLENLTARDGRRWCCRSLRTCLRRVGPGPSLAPSWARGGPGALAHCEVCRMARRPAVNRRPKGIGGSIPSLAARAVFLRREAPVSYSGSGECNSRRRLHAQVSVDGPRA